MEKFQSNKELRIAYKKLREKMSPDFRNKKSHDICKNVLALLESDFKGANIFLCFYPFGSEVDLLPLYSTLLDTGKALYFPVCNCDSRALTFYKVSHLRSDFHLGSYNIMEPDIASDIFDCDNHFNEQVVSITPGLIFDKSMNRIGYGAGFYDRFFEDKPGIIKLAPIFSEQLIDKLDVCDHDIPMNYIVTENEVLKGDLL